MWHFIDVSLKSLFDLCSFLFSPPHHLKEAVSLSSPSPSLFWCSSLFTISQDSPFLQRPCALMLTVTCIFCSLCPKYSSSFFLLWTPRSPLGWPWSAPSLQNLPDHPFLLWILFSLCLLLDGMMISWVSVPARYRSPLPSLPTLRCRAGITCYPFWHLWGPACCLPWASPLEIPYERMDEPSATSSSVYDKCRVSFLEILEYLLL